MSRVALVWRRSLLGFGVVVGASSLGCGSRTPIDLQAYEYQDAAVGQDATLDIAYEVWPDSVSCNPSNCKSGCCDSSGQCKPGTGAQACGSGGYVCVDCTQYGASCDPAKHQCTGFTPCSATSCPDGCCADAYTCVPGTDATACGKGGQGCADCQDQGLTCSAVSHSCEASKCGPATCSGCCDGKGLCVTGTEATACGQAGGVCNNCAASGLTCSAGTCQATACNPSTCPFGCCDKGQCVLGTSPSACGSNGQSCVSCGPSETCQATKSGGQCIASPSCNPQNCAFGCCDFSTYPPACVKGMDPWQCGAGGQVCQYCAGPNQYCQGVPNGGQCMGDCSPQNCPFGCCDPNTWPMQCVKGMEPWACGSGGMLCQQCAPDQACEYGPSGGYCGSTTGCNPATCPWGCCDPNTWPMQCVGGVDPWACGSNGQTCQACAGPGQQCIPSYSGGMCSTSGYCDPSNCPGCCDYNQYPPQCVPGYDPFACGVAGMSCQMCGPMQKCDQGKCVGSADCGPWNCPGCCNFNTWPPQCLPGFEQQACGVGGQQCILCDLTQSCSKGVCVGPGTCGPGTCSGCCDYNAYPPICMPGQDPFSCGFGGNSCTMCPPGSTCQKGQCQAAPLCGPGTCAGCCDKSVYPPKCLSGFDPKSCGTDGQSCTSCGSGELCVMTSSGGGVCKPGAACGPTTCNGCCDWNGVCLSGDTNASCGAKGLACSNCFVTNQICDTVNGVCVTVPNCGPANCPGCCTKSGACMPGYVTSACGHGGVLCEDCSSSAGVCQNSTCTGGSSSNCPIGYPGCAPAENIPLPTTSLNACSTADLKNANLNCSGSPTPPTCGIWYNQLKTTNPACYKCLMPFTGPKAFGSCLAPYLDPGCNHDLACSLDCQAVACGQCPEPQKSACQDQVWSTSCGGYLQGLYCAQAAMQGPGAFCTPTDYGSWLYSVGNHYCGTGAP